MFENEDGWFWSTVGSNKRSMKVVPRNNYIVTYIHDHNKVGT